MEKRYQVFISSTFTDLKEERSAVIQTVMQMDCIPAGMELFPAIDDEQFNFIKKVIDDCDYYILIIGGRYGSLSDEGLSYTELEYDYAVTKGMKVIALIHKEPGKLSVEKSETNETLRNKLVDFKSKVSESRLVKFWTESKELSGLVALSLLHTIKTYPAVGWVRANTVNEKELLVEINNLRKANEELNSKLLEDEFSYKSTSVQKLNLADLSETILIRGTYAHDPGDENKICEYEFSWNEIFKIISPKILSDPNENNAKKAITNNFFYDKLDISAEFQWILDDDFQTIKIQLMALDLIETSVIQHEGKNISQWKLTKKGYNKMIELKSVKKK